MLYDSILKVRSALSVIFGAPVFLFFVWAQEKKSFAKVAVTCIIWASDSLIQKAILSGYDRWLDNPTKLNSATTREQRCRKQNETETVVEVAQFQETLNTDLSSVV